MNKLIRKSIYLFFPACLLMAACNRPGKNHEPPADPDTIFESGTINEQSHDRDTIKNKHMIYDNP